MGNLWGPGCVGRGSRPGTSIHRLSCLYFAEGRRGILRVTGSVVEGSRGFEAGSILHGSHDEKGKLVILRGTNWEWSGISRMSRGWLEFSHCPKNLLAEKKFSPQTAYS